MFAQWLSEAVAANDLTDKAVGDGIGVAPQTVHKWRHGETTPKRASVLRLADYFQADRRELLDLAEQVNVPMPPTPKVATLSLTDLAQRVRSLEDQLARLFLESGLAVNDQVAEQIAPRQGQREANGSPT